MRILKTTQTYYPYLNKGGPPAKVKGIARALAQRGHEVTVLTAELGDKVEALDLQEWSRERIKGEWGWEWQHEGVRTIYLPTLANYRATTISPRVLKFCHRNLTQFDVAHLYGFYDLIGPTVARLSRRSGVPYVIEPLGMFRPRVRSLGKKRVYHRLVGNSLIRNAAAIIATSETERKELIDEGLAAEKILLRRNGLDLDEFQSLPARGALRSKLGIGEREPLVLFLGRVSLIKGLDVLVRAFAEIDALRALPDRRATAPLDARLVIAGPDDQDGSLEAIRALIDQLNLSGRVDITGPLYGAAKLQAFADMDIFVLPSKSESFGNAAAESVASGVPVVVTHGCGIASLIDQRAGLAVECTVEGIRAGLERLLDDHVLLARLRAGCPDVAKGLSWDGPIEQMERIYSSLLAPANHSRTVTVARSQALP